jgi:type IV secretion system protein VirB4
MCVFGAGWGVKTTVDYLRDYQKSPRSTGQLFNFDVAIDDPQDSGFILLRNGTILTTYRMDGIDVTTATDEHLEGISQQLNKWLKKLDEGWAIYVTNRRNRESRPSMKGTFSSATTKLIDQLREQQFSESDDYFSSTLYLSVAYKPSAKVGSKQSVKEYKKRLFDIEDYVENFLGLRQLTRKEHLSFLYDCINFEDRPITERNHFISPVLTSKQLITGRSPKVGEYYFSSLSIIGYPDFTYKGMLQGLDQIDIPMRWTSRIITLDKETQRSIIKKERNYHGIAAVDPSQKAQKALVTDDDDSIEAQKEKEALSEDAQYSSVADGTEALSAIREGEKEFYQFTSTILLYDTSKEGLEEKERKVEKYLKRHDIAYSNNGFNDVDAWIGSVPAHVNNQKRYLFSTENIADIISTSSSWKGAEFNPSDKFPDQSPPLFIAKTRGHEPFRHHRPAIDDIGHGMYIGDTGSGKSVYVNAEIAAWDRIPNSQVFVFDNGYSGQILCEAVGGKHFDLASGTGGQVSFQPFRELSLDNKEERQWASSFIDLLFKMQGEELSGSDKSKKIMPALQELSTMDPDDRTFSTFQILLQDTHLKEVIKIYTKSGHYDILDGIEPEKTNNHHQVFELSKLENLSDEIYIPTLLYLFNRVRRSLDSEIPTLVCVEEAWQAFNNPIFSKWMSEQLLTWRKYNGHLNLVVHKPSQLKNIPQANIFVDSCKTKIFCPNPDARSKKGREGYDIFDLNDRELEIIAQAKPRREYFEKTAKGASLYELDLTPAQLSLLTEPEGYSLSSRQKKIKELKNEYGQKWPGIWLDQLGHSEASQQYFDIQESFSTSEPQPKKATMR